MLELEVIEMVERSKKKKKKQNSGIHVTQNDHENCIMFPSDTMENWDEKKLEEVVNKKHGEAEKKKAKTQIVRVFC